MQALLDAVGLYHGQPPVLNTLWEQEGMTQTEIAAQLNRSPSTITKMVQRMEKAGFIERRDDPEDERISRVYLTDAGRDVRSKVETVWHTFAAQAFVDFSDDDLQQFHTLLRRLYQNLEES
jgi:DNA-binding MarR family transcriptional regulator